MSLSVCIVTRNRSDYLKRCLDSLFNQRYPLAEVIIVDNGSTDNTVSLIKENYAQCRVIENRENLGQSKARNQAIEKSKSEYIFCLDDDLILDKEYLDNLIEVFSLNKVGSVQGKILQYDLNNEIKRKDIIDSLGFKIFKNRRIIDRGRGERDEGQYDELKEIFSPNTAAVVFKKQALEEIKIFGEYFDEDFFRVAEDVDLGWRLRLAGWSNFYQPQARAWHDSHSSKRLTRGYFDFIRHRRTQPIELRKLDFRNQHLMFVKNEIFGHLLKDLLYFLYREIKLLGYLLFFEPNNLKGIFEFFFILPKMLKKRREIRKKRRVKIKEMSKYFE